MKWIACYVGQQWPCMLLYWNLPSIAIASRSTATTSDRRIPDKEEEAISSSLFEGQRVIAEGALKRIAL